MRQNYLFLALFILLNLTIKAQSFAPPVGQEGTTAIHRDSGLFTSWATGVTVVRGPQNIINPTGDLASMGLPENATGKSNGQIVSLGDGGTAILTFETPIANGDGFDFAIFENSFSNTFLELGFVEVSSDGENFFRFPSHSQTQTDTQVGGFGNIDATYIHNFAGKYKASYGTPFNLDDVANNSLLNKAAITHVKIIDVIGTIDPVYATYDSHGNIVNDPYATPFSSSGFDLDAIGVINEKVLGVNDLILKNRIIMHPNPATSKFYVSEVGVVSVYTFSGGLVLKQNINDTRTPVFIDQLNSGIYLVQLQTVTGTITQKLVKK